jgi:hypothetical protein
VKRYRVRWPVEIRCAEEWDQGAQFRDGVLSVEIEGSDRDDALARLGEAVAVLAKGHVSSRPQPVRVVKAGSGRVGKPHLMGHGRKP